MTENFEVSVLRYGHRPFRDKRITTHVALTARAFGASSVFIDQRDEVLEQSVHKLTDRFGGNFRIESGVNWRRLFENFSGTRVHLTMYGIPVEEAIPKIKERRKPVMVFVGSQKVPPEVYSMADFNVSVTNQPHSEIAALAIFLDRYNEGRELKVDHNGKLKVIPTEKGKKVEFIPNEKECLEILSEEGASDLLISHLKAVKELAVRIAERCGARLDLVIAGSLLHDIGRTRTQKIDHAVVGAKILADRNVSSDVVRIVERHIGAGITADEAAELGLPEKDYVPETLEEKIVAQADNLFSGATRIKINIVAEHYRKLGLNLQAERILRLQKELSSICGADLDDI
ncbi:MAG: tRNA (cytidine(56)-2'-O)-methyltransferase [Thermoplasmata archaeon]